MQKMKRVLKREMKIKGFILAAAASAVMFLVAASPVAARRIGAEEAEVRGLLDRAFRQLRAGEYDALYDVLPIMSQRRISRSRFVSALERTRGMYELDRLEINRLSVSGDVAAVDTTLYGRLRAPFEGEGKVVARQYLVRENGEWRVAVGERRAVRRLLADQPQLARRFPPSEPRVYVKRDGRWAAVGSTDALRRGIR